MQEFKGKVRVVHKDYPLPSHAGAVPAAEAARCAAAQGVFWEYHDCSTSPCPPSRATISSATPAASAIDRDAFATCIDSRQFRKQVETDVAEGRAIGVRGTPTFVINGTLVVGAQPIEAFREAVRDALKDTGTK